MNEFRLTTGYAGPLHAYSPEIDAQIGALMPHLDSRHDGSPIGEERLRRIIDCPTADQLIVTQDRLVVATATVSQTWGPFEGRKGYLADVVVHPDYRKRKVAETLWRTVIIGARRLGADGLHFATETWRPGAIKYYERKGVQMDPQGIVCYYTLPEAGEGPW